MSIQYTSVHLYYDQFNLLVANIVLLIVLLHWRIFIHLLWSYLDVKCLHVGHISMRIFNRWSSSSSLELQWLEHIWTSYLWWTFNFPLHSFAFARAFILEIFRFDLISHFFVVIVDVVFVIQINKTTYRRETNALVFSFFFFSSFFFLLHRHVYFSRIFFHSY